MIRLYRIVGSVVLAASLSVVPTPSLAGVFVGVGAGVGVGFGLGVSVNIAPPPLPIYEQPPCVRPDTIWTPGYWAYGPYGYFWVPGTWVAAPRIGYLWTPGYWAYRGGAYAWHAGYWGPHVGFYGGVNYGFGYAGTGFFGGGWTSGHFRYNAAVTNVNRTTIRNVYVNRSVVVNNYDNTTINRVSYNGGPGGLQRRATASDLAYRNEPHLAATALQTRHIATAAQNRYFLASVNHDSPPDAAVTSPLSRTNRPARFAPPTAADRDRAAARRAVSRFDRPAAAINAPQASRGVRDAETDRAPSYAHTRAAHESAPPYHTPSYARSASRSGSGHMVGAASAYRTQSAHPSYHAPSSYYAPRAYHSAATHRQPGAPRAAHSTQHAAPQHHESGHPHPR